MFKLVVVLLVFFGGIYAQSDQEAEIVNFQSNNNPDGTYQYIYETSNGISHRASGVGGESEEGEVRYVSDNGTPIEFTYTADEGGFQPVGAHIPQEPAPPAHVARLIEWLGTHPEESSDDGSYRSSIDDGSYREQE